MAQSVRILCVFVLLATNTLGKEINLGTNRFRKFRSSPSYVLHGGGSKLAPDSQFIEVGKQAPGTVSHKSWFERLGESITSVLAGLFAIIPFSIALLWVNERRNAELEALISHADVEAETIDAAQKNVSEYDGVLVHLDSESARGLDPVVDERFPDVKMESGCLMLSSDVEVYQWKEEEHTETKKDSVGGGETKVTTYTYEKVWSKSIINSSEFHDSRHQNTGHVQGLCPGSKTEINSTVKYGEHYFLPEELTRQVGKFEDASKLAGGDLRFKSYVFKQDDDFFYCPGRRSEPNIGDFRVQLTYAPDGPASILALQMQDKAHDGGHTFGPYRAVPRGLCGGITDDELKTRLLDQAKKDGDELYEEQRCLDFGPFACMCCCCNLVTYAFTHLPTSAFGGAMSLTPEICSGWAGSISKKECLASVKMAASTTKWVIRLVGWILLWVGFNALFRPFEVLLDIIPFLGPYLGSGFATMVSFISFLLTLVLAFFIVSVAYLIYHPIIGMVYLLVTTGVVVSMGYATKMIEAKHKQA